MRNQLPFLVFCAILFPAISFASPKVQKTVLDNGLTVLIAPMPSVQSVSVYAYVKTGAATEGRFLGAGISHFIEHMMFKGTKRRGVGDVAKEVKRLGGHINASTDLDNTVYTLDLPKEKLANGIDLIADMLRNSVFDPVEVEKERQVIHGEMRLYDDKPQRRLSVNVFKNVFHFHPYQHRTIGYETLFDGISRADLYGYYQRNYIPNNMIISIAGALDPEQTLKMVKQQFADFKQKPYVSRNIVPEPPQVSERYQEEHYETPLFWFSLAFQGISINDPDVYALDLLGMALSSGETSRLYQVLYKDKKIVTQISASDYTPLDKGVFEIQGMMDADHLQEVRDEVMKILAKVKRSGLTPEELQQIKVSAQASLIYSNLTASSVADKSATDEAMTGDVFFSEHYVQAITEVTNEDIKRVANKYLNARSLSVTVIKPLVSAPEKPDQARKNEEFKPHKYVLTNGMTLILKEDHTFPIVSMQAVFHGGLHAENKENNGISRLFASLLGRVNKNQSQENVLRETNRRAGSCSGSASKEAVGLSCQFLAKDQDYGLRLLRDSILYPVFKDDMLKISKRELKTEIDERNEEMRQSTMRQAMALLYQHHPNHMDMLGTKETIDRVSIKDIEAYHQQLIRPSNMVLSIFGDIDSAKVKVFIESAFEKMKKSEVVIPAVHEDPPIVPRQTVIHKNKEQAVIVTAFLAPALTDRDRFAMEVVNTTLGAGLSGRLFVKIRDQLGKAYTVGSTYNPGTDTGNIALFCLTTNAKVGSVKAIMSKEIDDLATELMTDEEFASVKAYIKGSHQMSLDTINLQSMFAAYNELNGLGFDADDHFNDSVDAVTKEDVRNAVKKYLNPQKSVTVTTLGSPHS